MSAMLNLHFINPVQHRAGRRNLRLKLIQARIPGGGPGDVGGLPLAMRVLAVPSA